MISGERRRKKQSPKSFTALKFAACLLALLAGGTGHLVVQGLPARVSSKEPPRSGEASFQELPASVSPSALTSVLSPIQSSTKSPEPSGPKFSTGTSERPKARGAQASRKEKVVPMMNLSAYKPQARHAEKEVYLPPDRSQRASDLKRNLTPPAGEMEGEGLIYDVARAAKKTLDTVDDAALRGAKWALGDVASPDKATVRPDSSGLRLHIDVPAHTLKLPTR